MTRFGLIIALAGQGGVEAGLPGMAGVGEVLAERRNRSARLLVSPPEV